MSSTVRKLSFPVVVGSFVGVNTKSVNNGDEDDDGQSANPTSCRLYSQSSCKNPLKLNMSYATGNLDEKQTLPPTNTGGGNGPGSLLTIGISNSLSVISPLSKDSNSVQTAGLRHRASLGTKIDTHLLKAEELRKISKGFNISSRNAVKRWFVLYDDSHKPIGGGENLQPQRNLPPAATHHDIILDSSGSPVSACVDEPYYIPAHIEYHDNERKWRAGGIPNKDIILKDCFNICRKLDGAGIKDYVIAVATIKDTLDIIFEKEQDMLIWLELLLSCQQGGRSAQGRIAKPIYENMWEVNVKGFKSEKGSTSKFFQINGPHRLVATDETFKFFELGADEPIAFSYKDIKGHKNHNRNYIIQTGRMTRSGRGEIEIDCKDQHVAAQIYNTFEKLTKDTIPDKQHTKSSGHHGHFHPRQNSTSSSRSSRSRDSVQGHGNIIPQGASATVPTTASYRPRSESWSNPTVSHSLTGSKHGVLPGHPGPPTDTSIISNMNDEENYGIKELTPHPISSSNIPVGKQSVLGNFKPAKDLRYRTTSEGNHFATNISGFKSKGTKYSSITSGSPMSPGSYMSSESAAESAGSSNSIDDTEITYGPSMTPNADHPGEATIFEESSAESWVDPHDPKSIEEQIMREEEGNLKDITNSVQDHEMSEHSLKRQIGMSSLIHGENRAPPSRSLIIKESSLELGLFPSSCDSSDMKMNSSLHSNSNTARNADEDIDLVDSSSVSYAQLCLENRSSKNGEEYKSVNLDFLPGSHQALVGVPIPRYQPAFKRGNMGGDAMVGSMGSSPSQTQYASILNANDMGSMNMPSMPLSLVTTAMKATVSTDLTIATSPLAGTSSDYMLMSPPPPMATPPVPSSVNYASVMVANSNNANNNVSSTNINLASVSSGGLITNYSGSSSSTSSLKRQTSIGNGSNCGVRSNISTLERERRRLSMLGLDEGQITSMLMTSSLTGSVSNPRDPSSSLITSPSSQSSYNPLSDGGGIDREDITGADEEASVYTLMSPTGVSASETNCVPIPGAATPNAGITAHPTSQSYQYNKVGTNSASNRTSGRRSVGSSYKEAAISDFATSKSPQPQNIQKEEGESDPYVHMSPSVSFVSTSFKNSMINSYTTTRTSFSENITTSSGEQSTSKPLEKEEVYEGQERVPQSQSQNTEEHPSSQFGSRRGSKSSLSHLGSSPSAALTSHLSGPLLPLYTDVSNTSTTNSNLDQADESSPYLLMSPINTEEKPIVKEECDNSLSAALRGYSTNPIYSGTRPRNHRSRRSNNGSKRSSMCSDNDTGSVPIPNSGPLGPSASSTNAQTAEWLGAISGQNECKPGSRNSSLCGTPVGSLPSYNVSSSIHNYKSSVDGLGGESDPSKQRCFEKNNMLSEYPNDVYVPLSFGDDDATSGYKMPLQDHEIALSLSRRSTSSTSGNIQIPTRHGQHRNAVQRMSPASSSSLISGTPNSFKGVDAFSSHTSDFNKCNNDDRDNSKERSQNDDIPKPSIIHSRAFSVSSSNRPPAASSSNSSVGSALGSSGQQNTSGDSTAGKSSVKLPTTSQSGTSPNTMAARLGSWFRTRAGSVPARPPLSGRRRHRTTSEGDPNIVNPRLPENHQLEE